MLTERVQANVFISYSRDDGADLSRHLRKHLHDKGHVVFLDVANLSVGAKWKSRIETAIDSCDVFVLIITADAIKSNEVRDEFAYASKKRKVFMLLKHRSVQFGDLPWGLNERNMHEFNTQEELVRIFDEKFTEIDNLLTHDLDNPFVVQEKLKDLKREFDALGQEDIDKIKSYADDVFIPIITFLKKSPIFYEKEKLAINEILDRATKSSLNIEEKKEESSEEVFAKINAETLRLYLSQFLDYLLDLFVRNTPETRLQQLQSTTHEELDETVQVEPIATEAKDFLSISVDRDLSENRKYEYFKQNIENQRIDLRFFYLTPESVDLWFKIINFSDYKFNTYGRENIKRNAADLVNVILEKSATDHVDLVDLGVGAAVKDYYLLKALLERMPQGGKRMNYVPLDYSIAVLQKVMDYTEDLMDAYPNKLHIEGVLGDFYRLVRYRRRINELSESPKVCALLGNILGNADEYMILTAITESMNPNDFFLLEIDLIDDRIDDKLKEGYGSDDITKNFLLSPILKHSPKYRKTGTKIEDFELDIDIQKLSIIPNSKTVVTSAYYGENNSEKMDLVRSHKYDLQSLVDYLYYNWKLGHIKTYQYNSSSLLLLQKLPKGRNLKAVPLQVPQSETQTLQ
jgi:uncharacterized SAM-dependent methyltransferase